MPLGYVQAVQDIALGIYKDRAFFRDFVPSCFRSRDSHIEFQKRILARPEEEIRVRRTGVRRRGFRPITQPKSFSGSL